MEPMPLWQGILGIFIMLVANPIGMIVFIVVILALLFGRNADKAKAEREKVQKETDFLRAWAVKKVQEEESKPTLDEFLARMRKRG